MPIIGMLSESNIAPVLALIWLAPAVFALTFVTTLAITLFRGVAWNQDGKSLPQRLIAGEGPVDIAFCGPVALLVLLWILTWVGGRTVHYGYYPGFLKLMALLQLYALLLWVSLTWRNAGRLGSRGKEWALKTSTALLGGLLFFGAVGSML